MHMIMRKGPRDADATRRALPRRQSTRAPLPLDVVYAQAGIPAPRTRPIAADRIPSPYRSLLVHEHDMTLTL